MGDKVNPFVKEKYDIESNGGEKDNSSSSVHRTFQCFFAVLFTLLGTAFVNLLCQPQLVDPEIVKSSTITFPVPPAIIPLNDVNNTLQTNTDPALATMRHEQAQINQILNSGPDGTAAITSSNSSSSSSSSISSGSRSNKHYLTKSSTVSATSSSSKVSLPNTTRTAPPSSSTPNKGSEHIKLVRESGQYYLIIHNVKHGIAKDEFDYFNLKLDDVENLIPNSKISQLPNGEPFIELPDPFRLEVKKKFKAENHYGFYTSVDKLKKPSTSNS